MRLELLYFANPMCSWCWGFAPVVQALTARHRQWRTTIATGRLGEIERPMRPKDKAAVRDHWTHVREATGQSFDGAFAQPLFEGEDFVYDTRPACRALAVLRQHYPALTLTFLHRLHERFYALGHDLRDPEVLGAAAGEFGLGGDTFRRALDHPDTARAVEKEWTQTAALGVTGYPTLLALTDGKAHVLSIGCRPLDDVEAALTAIRT